jgi:hypothetical protein
MNERIAPPCHPNARLVVEMATEGRPYMQHEVADGFYCDAFDCYNTWDREGNPT